VDGFFLTAIAVVHAFCSSRENCLRLGCFVDSSLDPFLCARPLPSPLVPTLRPDFPSVHASSLSSAVRQCRRHVSLPWAPHNDHRRCTSSLEYTVPGQHQPRRCSGPRRRAGRDRAEQGRVYCSIPGLHYPPRTPNTSQHDGAHRQGPPWPRPPAPPGQDSSCNDPPRPRSDPGPPPLASRGKASMLQRRREQVLDRDLERSPQPRPEGATGWSGLYRPKPAYTPNATVPANKPFLT
jgi:hypothetical protein